MSWSRKDGVVQDALSRIGGIDFPDLQITGSQSIYGYRNKVQFPVQSQNGKNGCRLYRAGSHTVIPITDCKIQPEVAKTIRAAVLFGWRRKTFRPTTSGRIRALSGTFILRCGVKLGQTLVCIVANCEALPKKKTLVREILAADVDVTGIVVNYNTKKSNVILGERFETLYGEGYLEDMLLGLTFRLSPAAFYQVNHDQAERLYKKAIEFARFTGEETALDLYCGSGTITLCLARHVKTVYGVEIVDAAICDAKENARRNEITNAEFFLR